MTVSIQTARFEADSKLINYVQEQVGKLPEVLQRITTIEIYLKLDNLTHQITDKIAEIRAHAPHHEFFASRRSKSFEQSFDQAFDSLVTQIRRQKDKTLH